MVQRDCNTAGRTDRQTDVHHLHVETVRDGHTWPIDPCLEGGGGSLREVQLRL